MTSRKARWLRLAATGGVVAALAGALGILVVGDGNSVESVPLLASPATSASGKPVDGIRCDAHEQLAYHVHAHLAVFVDGSARNIPAGIGIPSDEAQGTPEEPLVGASCIYWLHTHAADGIIHIESPVEQTYTLGQFFDIWGEPLDASRVGPASGAVTAYVNGTRWEGSPRDIPLTSNAVLQLDAGRVVPPQSFDFGSYALA